MRQIHLAVLLAFALSIAVALTGCGKASSITAPTSLDSAPPPPPAHGEGTPLGGPVGPSQQ